MPHARTFIHISDMHFRAGRSNTVHDADQDVRAALLRDVRSLRERPNATTIDGILFSGDVAFAGQPEEYAMALDWIGELTASAGCPRESVWIVPGNHDVDRTIVDQSNLGQALREKVRGCAPAAIDEILHAWLSNPVDGPLLFAPLQAYNDFAATFECRVTAAKPFWERRFTLNDGSQLCLRGMTSVLVSDSHDDEGSHKLVVGAMQTTGMTDPGVAYLAICHHPPEWLRDYQTFEDVVGQRARVQLFGHMHRQRVRQVGESLRLSSGALHPDRRESAWDPVYNVLSLTVDGVDQDRWLVADVEDRAWHAQAQGFLAASVGGAAAGPRQYRLKLDPGQKDQTASSEMIPIIAAAAMSGRTSQVRSAGTDGAYIGSAATGTVAGITEPTMPEQSAAEISPPAVEVLMDPVRQLGFRFMTLSHRQRGAVVYALSLVCNEDDGLRDAELFERYFERARKAKRLHDFWGEVERHHTDPAPPESNPFSCL